jgi:small subunit ribosomal protein S29
MPPRLGLRRLPAVLEDLVALRNLSALNNPSYLAAPFSTSSRVLYPAPVKKKPSQGGAPRKGQKTLKIKKDRTPRHVKKVDPTERLAFKNRIVLSNTNANEVALPDLDVDNMVAQDSIGKMFAIPGPIVDSLRAVGAFQRGQKWDTFRKPATLLRQEAWELGKLIEQISAAEEDAPSARKVIYGDKRTGKTVLLLQAMTMAFLKNWVVINIPECELAKEVGFFFGLKELI